MEILTNVVVNEFSYWQQIIHDHLMILHHTREILLEDLVDALERKDTTPNGCVLGTTTSNV